MKNSINTELLIQKYRHGVKLTQAKMMNDNNSVANILRFPFNVFFLDLHQRIRSANEIYADSCHFSSVRSALNKTASDIFNHKSAEIIMRDNAEIIATEKSKTLEMAVELKKDADFQQTFIMKLPLYSDTHEIIGLMGFSLVIGKHALIDFFTQIAQLGLLNQSQVQTNITKQYIAGVYLTKRQIEILRLMVRGQSSKEIAVQVGLSYRTVQHYLENIKTKFDVSSQSQLIEKVIDDLR